MFRHPQAGAPFAHPRVSSEHARCTGPPGGGRVNLGAPTIWGRRLGVPPQAVETSWGFCMVTLAGSAQVAGGPGLPQLRDNGDNAPGKAVPFLMGRSQGAVTSPRGWGDKH